MNKTKLAKPASIAFGTVALALGGQAFAQDWTSQDFIKPYDETVQINLGGIVNQFDTSLRLDGQNSQGTNLNLENNGLKKNLSSFEAALQWRIAQRHRLDFDYYTVKRSGSHTYSGEIDLGDNHYPYGASVGMSNKYDLFAIDYRYSFIQDPDYEIAGLFGFYGGKVTFDVNAVGTLGTNNSTVSGAYNKSVSTTIPLPMIGASWDWYPNRQTKLSALGMGMKAQIGSVDGHAYVLGAGGEYLLTRNLGVGARYTYVDISATVKSDFNGDFSWRVNTFSLYAKLEF